jgi:hypothetical protein
MTMPDGPLEPRSPEAHPVEELPALLNGELALDELRRVIRHLRRCPSCQAELVEVAAAIGVLRHTERAGMTDTVDTAALPPLRAVPVSPDRPGDRVAPVTPLGARRHRLLALAAVIVLIVGGGALVSRLARHGGAPALRAPFAQVGTQPAQGSVEMTGRGASRTMTVSASLAAAPPGSYYEVWLLDAKSGGMVPVGVLPTGGTARFALPSLIVARYNAVDVSLQPDNGSTIHSKDSVLRATYAT